MAMADNLYFSDGRGNAIPALRVCNCQPQSVTGLGITPIHLTDFSAIARTGFQPGVAPIVDYLASLPYKPDAKCEQGHFYVLNNVLPGFHPDGTLDQSGPAVPPSSVRSIGDALIEKGISFRYYGGGFNFAVGGPLSVLYCPDLQPLPVPVLDPDQPCFTAEHLKRHPRPVCRY